MLETPSMHQYDIRDNLCAADNQQGRPVREPSTTTCSAPVKKQKKQRKHKEQEGYYWDNTARRWVRVISDDKAFCCDCGQWKPTGEFANIKGKPYSYCRDCQRLHKAMSRYKITRDEAANLYSQIRCECCGCCFVKQTQKHIHHLGSEVVGVLCLTCNHMLRDESPEHLHRLRCCVSFIEDRVKI